MDSIASRWQIETILKLVRATPVSSVQIPELARHDGKTYRFITKLGYNTHAVKCELDSLKCRDYSEGPKPDDKGRPHDVWVFGKYLEGFQTYIKFTVFIEDGRALCVCISFHEASWPMRFPYRESGAASNG